MSNFNTNLLIAAVAAIADAISDGADAPQVIVWSGSMPALLSDPIVPGDNVMLVSFNLSAPVFGPPQIVGENIEALGAMITPVAAEGAGLASFYRVYDGNGEAMFQAPAGVGLVLNQNNIVVGAMVSVTSLIIGMLIA